MKVSNLPIAGSRRPGCTAITVRSSSASRRRPVASTVCSRRSSRRCSCANSLCCGVVASCSRPATAGSRGSIRRDIAEVAAAVLADPDPPDGPAAPHRSRSADRRRARGSDREASSARDDRAAAARSHEVGRRACRRAAWIRGSPTRPCTSTKRSRGGALADVSDAVGRVLRQGAAADRCVARRRACYRCSGSDASRDAQRIVDDVRLPIELHRRRCRRPTRIAVAGERGPRVRGSCFESARASSSAPTNSAQPSTKLPNVNGMSMPWHAPRTRVVGGPAEQVRVHGSVRALLRRASRRRVAASRRR